jgi:hypothetical protein
MGFLLRPLNTALDMAAGADDADVLSGRCPVGFGVAAGAWFGHPFAFRAFTRRLYSASRSA